MAIGKVQLWEGKVLLVGGKVAVHDDCCCCPGASAAPSVTVTIGGTCADQGFCDDCDSVNGAYSLANVADGDAYFGWHYQSQGAFDYYLACIHPTADGPKSWCAVIEAGDSHYGYLADDCSIEYAGVVPMLDVTDQGITVVDGTITGTIVLPGDNYGYDCSGCTATIVMS